MTTSGTVRMWNGEEGWGVIDSPATPGGCWTRFSHVLARSYRHLQVGDQVLFEWEPGEQDGYRFRAVSVYLSEQPPGDPLPTAGAADT